MVKVWYWSEKGLVAWHALMDHEWLQRDQQLLRWILDAVRLSCCRHALSFMAAGHVLLRRPQLLRGGPGCHHLARTDKGYAGPERQAQEQPEPVASAGPQDDASSFQGQRNRKQEADAFKGGGSQLVEPIRPAVVNDVHVVRHAADSLCSPTQSHDISACQGNLAVIASKG